MSLLKTLQLIANSSGLTDTAQSLLEKAVSKDAQDQINVLSARAAYLHEKVVGAESVIVALQTEVGKVNAKRDEAQKELNDAKIMLEKAYKEGFEAGMEKGREDANEDRDAQDPE